MYVGESSSFRLLWTLSFRRFFLLSARADVSLWRISLYGHLLRAPATCGMLSCLLLCCWFSLLRLSSALVHWNLQLDTEPAYLSDIGQWCHSHLSNQRAQTATWQGSKFDFCSIILISKGGIKLNKMFEKKTEKHNDW